jgi:hypothetical protein
MAVWECPSELPPLPRWGLLAPRLLRGASWFCVGTCIRRGHSGSRLRRRHPFTGGSECPTPTDSTLGPRIRRTHLVAFERRTRCGEHRTTPFDRAGSTYSGERASNPCGRCTPSLLAASPLAQEGGLAPSITANPREASELDSEAVHEYTEEIAVVSSRSPRIDFRMIGRTTSSEQGANPIQYTNPTLSPPSYTLATPSHNRCVPLGTCPGRPGPLRLLAPKLVPRLF